MVKSSPGIIIVAKRAAKRAFLPANSRRAKAKAERMVMTSESIVDTTPTYRVLRKSLPRFAEEKASR